MELAVILGTAGYLCILVSIAFTASKYIDSLLIFRSIIIRLVLQVVLMCQRGNIESPSTIPGSIFKACVVLYNLQAFAHFVGTIGFWRVLYLLPDYWKWRLAPPRREDGLRKVQEREMTLQGRELDTAANPV